MKKLIIVSLISLIIVTACKKTNAEKHQSIFSQYVVYDYDSVIDKTIVWNNLLNQEILRYYVYVYSPTCGHCCEIKQQVIEQSLGRNDFFFVLYNNSIPVGDDVASTIGATDLENIFILGTPSLLTIENGILISNIAGKNAILQAL